MLCLGYISFFIPFIFHKQVLGSCLVNCAECSKNGDSQKCVKCINGHWLTDDNVCSLCPDNCKTCTSSSQCTKCKSEFWDIRPYMICSSPCDITCTGGCNDTTGHCFGCNPGFYGPRCDWSCDLCVNKLCTHQRCMTGCIDGYYENKDNDVFECKKCQNYCLACESIENCTRCERGYYLFRYEVVDYNFCYPCSPPCEECISSTDCVCKSGKYGPTCSKDCNILNCKSCIEVGSIVNCTECISGYTFLNGSCIPGTNLCPQYCSNGCDINQNCLGGCQDGWTGQKCTKRCADQCRKCDQNDAMNCEVCKGDFYTATCTSPCSLHCSALPGLPKCNINNGTCLNGCDNGYWDVKCDKRCYEGCNSGSCNLSDGFCDTCNRTYYGHACQNRCNERCVDNDASSAVCYRSNGTCVYGCKDGYGGSTCEDELTVTTMISSSTENLGGQYDENDKNDSPAKLFLLGMLTGVGICLLSIVAFVAVRQIRQRRKQSNGSQIVRDERPYVNTAVRMQAVSSTEEECGIVNKGSNQTSDVTPRSVYESLDCDRLEGLDGEDQHQYSELERQTDHHSTSYANL